MTVAVLAFRILTIAVHQLIFVAGIPMMMMKRKGERKVTEDMQDKTTSHVEEKYVSLYLTERERERHTESRTCFTATRTGGRYRYGQIPTMINTPVYLRASEFLRCVPDEQHEDMSKLKERSEGVCTNI